jgi:hypothetical protein
VGVWKGVTSVSVSVSILFILIKFVGECGRGVTSVSVSVSAASNC